jgi:hypothetical protein
LLLRGLAIACEILAGVAQSLIYGVRVISGGMKRRRSTMGATKTLRVELQDLVSSTCNEPEAPK